MCDVCLGVHNNGKGPSLAILELRFKKYLIHSFQILRIVERIMHCVTNNHFLVKIFKYAYKIKKSQIKDSCSPNEKENNFNRVVF